MYMLATVQTSPMSVTGNQYNLFWSQVGVSPHYSQYKLSVIRGLICSHDAEQLGHAYRKVYVVTKSVHCWRSCTSNAVLRRYLID